jgi:predicted O-methyltransferase YrrM
MSAVTRLRSQIAAASDRLADRVARTQASARRQSDAIDLAVAAALTESGIADLHDPVAYVEFLRACWQRDAVDVAGQPTAAAGDDAGRRFAALLAHLSDGMAAIPVGDAVVIARVSDSLLGDRTPFDRPGQVIDVGVHAGVSSSSAHSGRILTSVVRFMRSRSCLEIGTAYGLSALFLAAAQARGHEAGTVSTIECSEPQATLAFELLKARHPDTVRTFRGRSTEVLAEVCADGAVFDFLFHDGEHSGAAYVADFNAYEPHLAAGSVVLFDDITWEDPAAPGSAETFAGWTRITKHPRVAQSVVLDNWFGLLLLR